MASVWYFAAMIKFSCVHHGIPLVDTAYQIPCNSKLELSLS